MNEGYDQPFWVGFNNPRFVGAKHGYLPPLEDKKMDLTERLEVLEKQVVLLNRPYLTAKQNDTINQIKSGYLHLQRKVNELTVKKKQPDRYVIK